MSVSSRECREARWVGRGSFCEFPAPARKETEKMRQKDELWLRPCRTPPSAPPLDCTWTSCHHSIHKALVVRACSFCYSRSHGYVHDEDSPSILATMNNLANVLVGLGRFVEALTLYEEVTEKQKDC